MNFTASTAFEECTVAQLQDFLRNKGLPTKGNKRLLYKNALESFKQRRIFDFSGFKTEKSPNPSPISSKESTPKKSNFDDVKINTPVLPLNFKDTTKANGLKCEKLNSDTDSSVDEIEKSREEEEILDLSKACIQDVEVEELSKACIDDIQNDKEIEIAHSSKIYPNKSKIRPVLESRDITRQCKKSRLSNELHLLSNDDTTASPYKLFDLGDKRNIKYTELAPDSSNESINSTDGIENISIHNEEKLHKVFSEGTQAKENITYTLTKNVSEVFRDQPFINIISNVNLENSHIAGSADDEDIDEGDILTEENYLDFTQNLDNPEEALSHTQLQQGSGLKWYQKCNEKYKNKWQKYGQVKYSSKILKVGDFVYYKRKLIGRICFFFKKNDNCCIHLLVYRRANQGSIFEEMSDPILDHQLFQSKNSHDVEISDLDSFDAKVIFTNQEDAVICYFTCSMGYAVRNTV